MEFLRGFRRHKKIGILKEFFVPRSSGHSPLERMNRGSQKLYQDSLDKELN